MVGTQIDNALIGVEARDIERLSEQQLPQLLKILLDNSALLMGVPLGCWHVNADTKAPDGGVDASIAWNAKPEAVPDWFPGADVVFQCKACKKFTPLQCANELLSGKDGPVRVAVRDVLRRGGKYILVATPKWTDQDRDNRVDAMMKQIARKETTSSRKEKILIWDAGVLASWVNRFPTAAVQVLSWLGRQPPDGLLTWDLLSQDRKYANPFHTSPDQTSMITLLRQQLMQHKVWRIIGLPGAGKTRLLVEALRPDDDGDPSRSVPSRAVLYIDEERVGADTVRHAWSWTKSRDVSCTFVVDNCSEADDLWLAQEAVGSTTHVTLVTLSMPSCNPLPQETTLVLDRTPYETMKQILADSAPSLTYLDVEFAIQQAQGLPGIARTIAVQLTQGDYSVQALMGASSVGTMLAHATLFSPDEKLCLNTMCLFTRVGYRDSLRAESEYVARVLCDDMNADTFVETIHTLATQGYVKKRYGYASVSQDLLADRIAFSWWQPKDLPTVLELMTRLPDDLRVSFCERLSRLFFSDKAVRAVASLCEPGALLSDSVYLMTNTGARLLSAVAECNPEAAARCVSRAFASFTPEMARVAEQSAGALVEAMAKLCWWSSCFDQAAPVFLILAAGESTLPNSNVVEQYTDLFRWPLPGTQTPLLDRLSILDDALASPFEACRVLAVRALCNALTTGQCMRAGELWSQGGRRPQFDYWPRSRREIMDYWHEITIRLDDLLLSKEAVVCEAAGTGLISKVPQLIENGFQEVAEPIVRAIIQHDTKHLPALRNHMLELLDSPLELDKTRIESWVRAMAPTSLDERIHMYVLEGPEYLRAEQLRKAVEDHLTELAKYCNDHPGELADVIPLLLGQTSAPGPSVTFGRKLGMTLKDPWGIVDRLLETILLLNEPAERINVAVLGGLLASLRVQEDDRVELVLDRVRQDRTLLPFLVDITFWSEPGRKSLQRCLQAAQEGDIDVATLHRLTYPYILKELEPGDVASMAASVHSLGTPQALTLSLSLVCWYTSAHDERLPVQVRPVLRALLMDHSLPRSLRTGQSLDWHWWNHAVVWLLHEQDDQELAADLVSQLLSGFDADSDDFDRRDYGVDQAAPVLLKEYWPVVWSLIRETVTRQGLPAATRARIAFAGRKGDDSDLETGFSQITLQEAREWCTADQEHAPVFLLDLVPIGVRGSENEGYIWNEVARYMADEYGHNSAVQALLSERLRDIVGWISGGRSAKLLADLYKQLETSPNPGVQRWARSIRVDLEGRADRIDRWATDNEHDDDLQ